MSTATVAPEDRTEPPPSAAPPEAGTASRASRRDRARRRRRAATGAAGVDRANRVVLALLGATAMGLGVVVLLAADERIDLRRPLSLYADARRSAIDHQEVWTATAIAGGAVIALLGLWWAWAQVRPRPERGRLDESVLTRGRRGRTSIAPAPLARALAADVAGLDGVTGATARLVALGELPEVIVSAELENDADLPAVRAAMEAPLARLAWSLGVDAIDAEARFRIGQDQSARVA